MIIASVTITSNRVDIIGDAIKSVLPWVDMVVLIDLGITDETVDVALAIAGDKLRVVKYEGPSDTSAWRNFGNDTAHALGADWACTLDTDERMNVGRVNVRKFLERTEAQCLLVYDKDRIYAKERFFRLPATIQFKRNCHERIPANAQGIDSFKEITFSEIPKTGQALLDKYEFIERETRKAVEDDPTDSRSWFYLGDALAGKHDYSAAAEAFNNCAINSHDPAEAAWARFQQAVCLEQMEKFSEGIAVCAMGLTHHPGCAELAWWAGYLSLRMGQAEPAFYWGTIAKSLGKVEGIGNQVQRYFFSSPIGLYEGPFQVIQVAMAALGDMKASAEAECMVKRAIRLRQAA